MKDVDQVGDGTQYRSAVVALGEIQRTEQRRHARKPLRNGGLGILEILRSRRESKYRRGGIQMLRRREHIERDRSDLLGLAVDQVGLVWGRHGCANEVSEFL